MPNLDDASPGGLVRRPVPQHLDTDALSAVLDDRLTPDARSVAAAHLAVCPDCRRELAELRTAVDLLHGLPQYRPRRSFQLGPTYAGAVHGSRFARFLRFLPALRTATAVCALLLAVVTAANVLIDEEDAPPRSTEDAVVDEVNPVPADAREPTGREPLPQQEADRDVAAEAPASDGGGAGAPAAGDGADDEAVGANAPAPAPAPADRPAAAPVTADAADGGLAGEAEGQTAGGATTTNAGINAAQPAAPTSEAQRGLGDDDGLSVWQVAQLGLGLALAALVVGLIVLQRLANRARRLDPGF